MYSLCHTLNRPNSMFPLPLIRDSHSHPPASRQQSATIVHYSQHEMHDLPLSLSRPSESLDREYRRRRHLRFQG